MPNNKKILFGVLLFFPILISVTAFIAIKQPTIDLLNEQTCDVFPFNDKENGGNSFSEVNRKGGEVELCFKLDKDFDYPFAGIGFHGKNSTMLNIDGYVLNLDIENSEELRLSVRLQKELATEEYGKLNTILVKSFAVSPTILNTSIRINDVNLIPDWWFAQNQQVNKDIEINEMNSISNLWILTECITPRDNLFTIKFKKATLEYDYSNFIFYGIISLITYYILCALGLFVFKKTSVKAKKEYVYMPVEKTDIVNQKEEITRRMLDYIGHNYHNPEIKLSDVASAMLISEDKALDILKSAVNMTFRTYLNGLRIEEAKRLLQNSEYQISEIAFKVGYNNVQHFNRVFKEITGDTPRGYREK